MLLMRVLRGPGGGPSWASRFIAGMVALGLLMIGAPALSPVAHWALGWLL